MLGYGGLNRAEGRVTRIAHEWGTLRAVHDRGEIPPPVLLPRLTAMTDELAAVAASAPHPSLALARDTAADLRHRIALDVVARAPRPLVLPGVTCPGAGTGTGTDHPVRHLPDLWRDHRHDPVRRPAHPDAVGQPGTDGVPLDGEGGRLPDLFRRHWVDTAVAAAADPDVPLAEVDALMDRTAAVVRRHGATAAAVAALRARVLLGTGRIEQARELLDLTDEHAPGTAVTRATVALLRGDLDTLLRILGHGEDTGRAGTGEWILLTAASLVPLAHVVDAPTTVDRVAGVLAVATGVPDLVPAVLHVVEYLALAGAPEPALALLVRTVDVTDVPAAAAPALRAVADAGRSADPAADLGGRRLIAGGPTVRELADDLSAGLGLRAVHADARNGRAMWTTDVPASRDYPVPPLDAADLADVPGLVDLALPAALPVGPRVVPSAAVELPGVGPVDPASLDAADALCATVMYTLLGLADAADLVVDRMRCLTPDDGAPVVLDIAAEFVRRADCATGHGAGCFACARTVAATSAGLLAEIDRTVRDCACAGTAPDAPARVRVMLDRRPTAHPLVRRLIDLDVLLSGALPDREAVDCAVRGLWTAVRLLPRAVPLVGGSLLGVQEDVRRGLVDATVVTTLTTVAVALPVPPAVSPLGLVDHVADLADLAGALVGAGAYREACAVTAAGLDAVGGNWAASGVASGCTRGEVGADDDGPVRLLRARSAALAGLGNTVVAAECAEAAARAAEYRGRWRLAEACRVDAAARQG